MASANSKLQKSHQLPTKTFSVKIIRNVLHRFKYNGRVKRKKKSFKTEANREKHISMNLLTYGNTRIFLGVSKFNLFGSDGRKLEKENF